MKIKNIELTKELIEKMNHTLPIVPEKQFEYTPISMKDFPQEIRPVFTLKPLGGIDGLEARDEMRGEMDLNTRQVKMQRGRYVIYVCKQCIISWRNLYEISYDNTESKEIPFSIENINRIHSNILEEICDKILEGTFLTEEEIQGLK